MTEPPSHLYLKTAVQLKTAADVVQLTQEIFGARLESDGVIHPAAAWRDGERLRTLVLGPETPTSDLDTFSLNLARARADAVITTGRILRCEPELTHELQGPGGMPEALQSWRRDGLRKPSPPISLVLTSGRDLNLDHPLFQRTERSVVFTSESGHERLAEAASEKGVEVVGSPEPGIRSAIRFLQKKGAKLISVEAGPSTSQELYRVPLLVDELFLSVFSAPTLAESLQGGDLPPLQQLAAQFSGLAAFSEGHEGQGSWSFYRYFR